ncbi:aa3-type cytochrome c oxidase subunit IV [Novosphingobium sp.]|nr:aa3-type cytochrome c oxidase subunit IV [Novosphingobium sp.]MCC6924823.1 aa3-type cytochrome c oxidase subunit IV [Novosphingobium sp.]
MASGNDYKAHNATYEGFLGLVKWGIVATVLVTVFVIFMITN